MSHFDKRHGTAVQSYDPRRLDELPELVAAMAKSHEPDELVDEWRASGIEKPPQITEVFSRSAFFGCEADDRLNAPAFDPRLTPFGARLSAVFSSDIGHAFANAVRLCTDANPASFDGTAIEATARAESGSGGT